MIATIDYFFIVQVRDVDETKFFISNLFDVLEMNLVLLYGYFDFLYFQNETFFFKYISYPL